MRHLFFQLLLFVLILITARYTTADLIKGLVVYFTFDNVKDKRILDESGNGLDAEVIENTKFVKGKYGNAIHITSETEDCVNIPSADPLEIDEEITMMAWVYHEDWKGGSSQWFDKGSRGRIPHSVYGMAVFHEKDLGGGGWFKDSSGIGMVLGTGEVQQLQMVENTMKDEKWHHIVGIVGDNGVKIYLDGESILQVVNKNVNFKGINDEDLRIGCVKSKPQFAFEDGSIDEVAIWSRTLSEDEVRAAMRGPLLSVSPKGKVATTWGNIKRKTFYGKSEK